MARSSSVFKNSYNRMLDMIAVRTVGESLGSVAELGLRLDISGSTAAKLIRQLEESRIVTGSGRSRAIVRLPVEADYYPIGETHSAGQRLEEQFLRSIIGGDAKEGDSINELQIARRFSTSTSSVREFLIHFPRFGLIEKRPNRGWVLRGITPEFIEEVLTVREAFTAIAAREMRKLPATDPIWRQLEAARVRLLAFAGKAEVGDREFQDLENDLYGLIARASRNRFIEDFTEISLSIVYYNYRVDRAWEIHENKKGAEILVELISALISKDSVDTKFWVKRWIDRARYSYTIPLSAPA